jgi:alanine racemase
MSYSIQHIADILNCKANIAGDIIIEHLLIDSRKIIFPQTSLFFALHSSRRNGHEFIKEVYERGVKSFVVNKNFNASQFINANFLYVDDVLNALQTIAAHHRKQFNYPVIGITGSNGKTIVKEWLYQLLNDDYNIVRSPRSYNSQVGVPLSVWQMNKQNTLAIFEAGISTVNEMEKLEKIIQPTIGILTHIGKAHDEGFENDEQKVDEKLKLFTHCQQLIYCKDVLPVELINKKYELFSWSRKQDAIVFIENEIKNKSETDLIIVYQSKSYNIVVPFVDAASIDNAITCLCTLLLLNYSIETITEKILQLQPVEMRMQLKKAMNNCYVLNDSYSNDISSLSIALNYLKQQAGDNTTTVILSDILQSGIDDEQLYQQIALELQQRNIHRLIGVGERISKQHSSFIHITQTLFYYSTNEFLQHVNQHLFKDEFILLKGARVFEFERINKWLEQKVHQTILEINLSAIAHNLKEYQKHLLPQTKTMAMVKAFSYGSGSAEIARVLQFHKVDYLAVAYADEGIDLRKAGISLPIMVMNVDEQGFDALLEYNLEPEIYSFNIYNSFHQYLLKEGITQFPVHIKVNTGMNRLGFEADDASEIFSLIRKNNTMMVKSVFSHLVASESAEHDGFTKHQSLLFDNFCNEAEKILPYNFIKHIANSAAIFRHPNLQYNMVRLGIGLYGVDSANKNQLALQNVAALKSTIAQVRMVKAGDTIGYNRKGKVNRDSKIATIRIGYADGLSRKMSNKGSVFVNGNLVSIIGNVCMDMTMIDVTDIDNVKENDEVEIFGKNISVEIVAAWCETISYEIMTTVNQRVKRIYIEE